MTHLKKNHFTLIELIISMAIFAVIMLVLITMLNDTIKLSRKRKQQAQIYQQQQILSSILSRDFENMIANSEIGEEIYLYISTDSAAFVTTSTIGVDLNSSATCPLNGVFYKLTDSKLYRGILPVEIPYSANWGDPVKVVTASNNWSSSSVDSDVIAENVKSFSLAAFWADGKPRPTTTTDRPVLVNVTIEQLDEFDTDRNDSVKRAYRAFAKRIFISGGNR